MFNAVRLQPEGAEPDGIGGLTCQGFKAYQHSWTFTGQQSLFFIPSPPLGPTPLRERSVKVNVGSKVKVGGKCLLGIGIYLLLEFISMCVSEFLFIRTDEPLNVGVYFWAL